MKIYDERNFVYGFNVNSVNYFPLPQWNTTMGMTITF